jgi:hypothetical protein
MIGVERLVSKTFESCEAVIASLKQMGGRCRPPVGRHAPLQPLFNRHMLS